MRRLFALVLLASLLQCVSLAARAEGPAACIPATHSAQIGGGTIVYNVVGTGPSVLLLHGLFADKEQWDSVACRLADAGYRAIAVDLPGYGKSDGFAIQRYRLERQVDVLRALTARLAIDRLDLAGNSMGGAIGALYAARYPRQVRSVAFIGAPLGIVGWDDGLREAIFRGINPFIPISTAQLDLELSLLFVTPPEFPDAKKAAIVAGYVARNRHYVQVWNIVNLYGGVLWQRAPPRKPTLIVWGENDRIYNVAGAEKLHRRIPGSAVHVLPRAGHLVHVENASEVAPIYIDFLRSQ
jgi:pimeloyl-ACP methyl ester carboxylesterase